MTVLLILGSLILLFIGIVLLYTLLTILGTIIPVNTRYREYGQEIEIFLRSNGVHTDFVLPAVSNQLNWNQFIDGSVYKTPLTPDTYIAFGWGDRGFYLDTPTWAELKLKTALVAVFIPSPTVMHVTMHEQLPDDDKYFARIRLTREQYQYLCEYILGFFRMKGGKVDLMEGLGYTADDNFYEAVGSYHAFNTCNFWVNRGLLKTGVRTALWSPLDRGIFFQLKKVKSLA